MNELNIDYDAWVTTDAVPPMSWKYPNVYIPGVDVSKWQGKMDWAKCKAAGAKYAYIRCTVGMSSIDPQFERNYEWITEVKLPIGVYHAIVTRWGGNDVTAAAQMENFYEKLDGREFDFPVVLDCELTNGDNPRHITSVIEDCIENLEAEGFEVMIYTGQWWWDGNVMPADKWCNYPLSVANYTSGAAPIMPRDWSVWDIWQWSADHNGRGHEFGAESDDIDLDRMKVAFWNKYVGEEPEPEPSKVITLQQRAICGDDVYEGDI